MKFARFSRSLLEITRFRSPNGFHSNFYSTKAMPKREGSPAELYRRISPVGDPNISIVPILDQWVEEGRSVDEQALNFIIGNLWKHKRHSHALEVSRWMSEKADFELSSWHAAIRLQSIFKAQGMEQTEKYFNSLSQKQKGLQVYCGLLKCYASSQCVEKAEAVMGEMKDLGYAKKATEYNLMFNLYYKTRNMKKFDDLLQEMEEKGIVHNECTLAILFSAYAAVKDIEKMDKIVTKMESDPKLAFNWTNYTNTAACYEKAGLLDNAFEMLKKAEACLTSETCINAYDTILRQYATVGKKDEVLRFWSFYKKKCKVNNHGYICILSSLLKLGDFEMAEEIFYEWESRDDLTYDMNIPNSIIAAYSKKGLIEKAEALIDRAISKGGKPNNWTWYCLVRSYLENEQPEKAVEMMKKAIVNSKPGWKPDMALVEACLEYSKGVGDNEQIEEFANLLQAEAVRQKMKDLGYVKKATEYNRMLNLYYNTRNMEKFDDFLQEMQEKGIVHDKCTLTILFSAYAAVKDIEKMDKIVTKMEPDPKLAFNWTNYTNAAACYEETGLLDKAFEMLKKTEARLTSQTSVDAYSTILTHYTTIRKKDEVLRFWSFYKKKCKVNNHGYISILCSLLKFGDFEMAEEIFYERESRDDLTYDMNVPKYIIAAYSKAL